MSQNWLLSQELASNFAVGIVMGSVIGILLIKILSVTKITEYTYMGTVAVLLFQYVSTEFLSGSGVLSSFVYGLVIGNYEDKAQPLRVRIDSEALANLSF
ncbi:MAG: cation:proton antiporter domain-containing protein [Nitrososphaeria archaeon]